MRWPLIFIFFVIPAKAAIPPDVVSRVRYLIKTEVEIQSRASTGAGMCSEDEIFDSADRKLGLMEQTLTLANLNKGDKFGKLIEFFKEKMITKCCEISGKGRGSPAEGGGRGGGGGRGRGRLRGMGG